MAIVIYVVRLYNLIVQLFGGRKLSRFSDQKLLASKSLANSSLLAFFIVHTIIVLVINVPYVYIIHVSENEAPWTNV